MVLFYAVIGMSFFNGHVESRCRLTPEPKDGTWEVDGENKLTCGSIECPEGTYCGNPADYGLSFNHEEANSEPLLFGFNIFNRIDSAMFATYNFLMVTGWIQTTYIVKIDFDISSEKLFNYHLILVLESPRKSSDSNLLCESRTFSVRIFHFC